MELPEWAPADIDLSRPNAARVYDFFLGGAHNFAVDRELAAQISKITPNLGETMRSNRAFLRRAVRFLVASGIRQFLDIGSGIPTAGNVHQVAHDSAPDAKVVYVDVDRVAVAHSRAIVAGDPRVQVLCADLREPDQILADAHRLLDFDRPIAVLLAGVLHFIPDPDAPGWIVAKLGDAVVRGSYLLVSHATADGQPPEVIEAQRLSARTATEIVLRSLPEVTAFFEGFTLVEPGVVFIPSWRPDPSEPVDPSPERVGAYAGVGYKN